MRLGAGWFSKRKVVMHVYITYSVLCALCVASHALAAKKKCDPSLLSFLSPLSASTQAQWRSAQTHTTENHSAGTSAEREAKIRERKAFMEDYILNVGDTPEMEFLGAEGTSVKLVRPFDDGGTIAYIEVSGLGASGILSGTFLLPVSGHVGKKEALSWAKTDTYSLYVEDAGGTRLATLVADAKSLGLVTAQEAAIPLQANQLLKVTYYRSGSGGPRGYPSGRILEIKWDGT